VLHKWGDKPEGPEPGSKQGNWSLGRRERGVGVRGVSVGRDKPRAITGGRGRRTREIGRQWCGKTGVGEGGVERRV